MKLPVCGLLTIAALVSCFLGSAEALGQNAYIGIQQWSNGVATNSVAVIDTASNTVIDTIPVGPQGVGVEPTGVALTPDGRKLYVVYFGANSVSVIRTARDTVITTIPVGFRPASYPSIFIQPPPAAPRFAGTPRRANCYGKSISALARQYGGRNNAAATLGFYSVKALQGAIEEFCEA